MMAEPFVMPRLQAALAGLGLVAITTLAAGTGGYFLGYHTAQAKGDAALATLKASHSIALANATDQARARERELTEKANTLGRQLLEERDQHAQQADQLKRSIDRVTRQYRPAPGAPLQPAPRCVFTRGFVGVYNHAIAATSMPQAQPAAGAADAAEASEALDSGVQQADVLAHVADYGQRCRDVESQLNRLIDWHQQDGKHD